MHEIIPILGGSVQVSCQGMVTIIKRAPYVICATTPKQKGCDPSYHKHYQHLLSGCADHPSANKSDTGHPANYEYPLDCLVAGQ